MTARRQTILPWAVGIALVAAACTVSALTPDEQSTVRAIVSHGEAGETVTARTVSAELQDAFFSDQLVVDERTIAGNWLIVTAAASAPTTEVDASIGLASVTIDGRVYISSDQAEYTLLDADLRMGVRTIGMLAFELPADAGSGKAALRLMTQGWTPELDGLVEISFDLDDLPRESSFEIAPPAWEETP